MIYRELTVARVREADGPDHVEVLFLESSRIYRLDTGSPEAAELVDRLRAADAEGRAVEVGLESLDTDLIEDVRDL